MDFNPLTTYDVIGLVLTAATALITYFRSGDNAKSQNAAIASVIGGIFTLSMGLRFDVLPKVQSQVASAEVIRKDALRRSLLERVALLGPSITPKNPLMALVLKTRMERVQEYFDQIRVGQFIVDEAEMPLFNIQMIQGAKKSIGTTNYIGLSRWWEQPWGEKYEKENESAAKRGIVIARTFLFSKIEEVSLAKRIMNRQLEAGMKVRYAVLSELPEKLTGDIIVIDGTLVGEHHITPGKGLNEALFSTTTSDITRISRILSMVETNAEDFKP